MFDALSKGFRNARNRLSGLAELTEETVDQALRDVRLSLLEADVELNVTKRFLANVKAKAVGEVMRTSATVGGKKIKVGPAERFIKICQDELEALMRFEGPTIDYAKRPIITGIMMVGLQGAGKTTSAGKLARLVEKQGRKVLLVAADVQRPGAIEQLKVLGERINVPVFSIPGGRPVDICDKAQAEARRLKRDVIIYDTAGRLAIDDALMSELADIKVRVKPHNIFLVIDAMIGQDAVQTAARFHERLQISGAILTKLDGDARGGAALSVREVTGAPIKFIGSGEGMDRLEEFRADGMASRILGFGDVVGLMKDFEEVIDEEKAEADAQKLLHGRFTLDDFMQQITMLQSMGPLQGMLEKMPGFADSVPEGFQVNENELDRIKAIVSSMTKAERAQPELFGKQITRIKRVARGSGRPEQEVAELLQRFSFMQQMMGSIGKQAGILQKIPGVKQMAMASKLRDMVRTGGLEGNPMLANLADTLLEAAVAGGGGGGASDTRSAKQKANDKLKKKNQRKMQKKARKKSRK